MVIVISSQALDAFLVGSGWSLLFSDGLWIMLLFPDGPS